MSSPRSDSFKKTLLLRESYPESFRFILESSEITFVLVNVNNMDGLKT